MFSRCSGTLPLPSLEPFGHFGIQSGTKETKILEVSKFGPRIFYSERLRNLRPNIDNIQDDMRPLIINLASPEDLVRGFVIIKQFKAVLE